MGLLDMAQMQPQGSQQGGGLLSMASMPQQAPQGMPAQGQELQLAMMLSQSPTLQTAQQVIMKMRQSGMQGADEIEQHIMQVGNNPQALKQIADAVIQHFNGQ